MVVDEFEYKEGTVLVCLTLVQGPAMDRFRFTANWDGGGHVNGFEYSLDAIVENLPLEQVAKTRMGIKMIERCREDVLNGEWASYEQDLKVAVSQ